MRNTLIAQARITISAPIAKVWDALVNPEMIKQYLFGTNVVSDWKEAQLFGKENGKDIPMRTRA